MNFNFYPTAIAQKFLDEQLVRIVYQRLRCVQDLENGSEISLLLALEKQYKAYYIQRSNQLQEVLRVLKETCVNSYITYDKQYYQDAYIKSVQALEKFRQNVEDANIYEDFSKVGFPDIDDNYPSYFLKPQLLEFYKDLEKPGEKTEEVKEEVVQKTGEESTEAKEDVTEATEEELKQPGDAMP